MKLVLLGCLLATRLCIAGTIILDLPPTASGQDIQLALDRCPNGGEVHLGPGTFVIRQPILLRKDQQALCGTPGSTLLFLHDNPGAGISLDLGFNHNRIEDAELDGNDLGIFMRHLRDNTFEEIRVRHSRHDGIFIAQSLGRTLAGWGLAPGTECIDNSFSRLDVAHCGGRPVWINDVSCLNNRVTYLHSANHPTEPREPAGTLTAALAPALNSAGPAVALDARLLHTKASPGSSGLPGPAGASGVVPSVGSLPRILPETASPKAPAAPGAILFDGRRPAPSKV